MEKIKLFLAISLTVALIGYFLGSKIVGLLQHDLYLLILVIPVLIAPLAFVIGVALIPLLKLCVVPMRKIARGNFVGYLLLTVAATVVITGIMYIGSVGGIIHYSSEPVEISVPIAFSAAGKSLWPFAMQLMWGFLIGGLIEVGKGTPAYRRIRRSFLNMLRSILVYVALILVFSFGFLVMSPELLDADTRTIASNFFIWFFGALHFPAEVVENFATDPWYIVHYVFLIIRQSGGNLFKLEPLYPRAFFIGLLMSLAFNVPRLLFPRHTDVLGPT